MVESKVQKQSETCLENDGYFEKENNILYDFKRTHFSDFTVILSQRWNKTKINKFVVPFVRPLQINQKHTEYISEDLDDPFKFATDNLFTTQLSFKVTRNIFFYGTVRNIFKRLFEAGLLKDFQPALVKMTMVNMSKIEIYEKQEEYSTLTWEKL